MAEITRAEAASLLRQEAGPRILEVAAAESVALQAFTTVPMTSKTGRQSMANTIPTAGFTNGDTNPRKPVSEMSWVNKDLIAEEIAVIVPIPEDVLDDSAVNVLDAVQKACGEAIAVALDAAVISGIGKPTSWPAGLIPAAITASQTVELSSTVDIADGSNLAMGLVETLGYDGDSWVAPKSGKAPLRGLRNADGDLIYVSSLAGGGPVTSLWGAPIRFVAGSAWTPTGSAKYLVADSSLVVVGVRADVDIKVFDSGVIQASNGDIQNNLLQDDMVAVRVKARFGFNYGSVANPDNPTSTKTPFAAVVDATP